MRPHDAGSPTAYLQRDATTPEWRDAGGTHQPLKRALTFPSAP